MSTFGIGPKPTNYKLQTTRPLRRSRSFKVNDFGHRFLKAHTRLSISDK